MSVYFVTDGRCRVKIGYAENPKQRLQELQCGSADRLTILRVIDGSQPTERWLDLRFAANRLRRRGEWFAFADEMMTVVVPDEIPAQKTVKSEPRRTGGVGEYLRNADRLGLLIEGQRREFAPMLGASA